MRACGASVYCSNAPCSTRHNACSSAQHSTAPLAPAERNAVSVQLGLGLAWALAPTAPCTSGCGTYLDFVLHDQLCQLRFESRPAPHALVTDPPAREYHEHPPLDTAARMAQPRAWHSRAHGTAATVRIASHSHLRVRRCVSRSHWRWCRGTSERRTRAPSCSGRPT
jgi:hypothetical protein